MRHNANTSRGQVVYKILKSLALAIPELFQGMKSSKMCHVTTTPPLSWMTCHRQAWDLLSLTHRPNLKFLTTSITNSGAARGGKGEASHLWVDVQKLCNMCVLSLSCQWAKCKRQFSVPFLSCSCSRVDHVCVFLFEQINDDDDDELLRNTRQIHCKAVEQRATLIHKQYNRDWGTSYSRPPIDPYLTSPCYKILAAPLITKI